MSTVKIFLSLANQNQYELRHLAIKAGYLNANFNAET